jgi:hypothetical protein
VIGSQRDRQSTPALPVVFRMTEAVIDGAENENLLGPGPAAGIGPFPTVHPQIVAK